MKRTMVVWRRHAGQAAARRATLKVDERLVRVIRYSLALLAMLGASAVPAPAPAQDTGPSYITPFPEGDLYRVQVYGDTFAEGLVAGLAEAMTDDTRVQVQKKHRAMIGIARPEFEDDVRVEEATRDSAHIAVVMIGLNDRFHIRSGPRDRIMLGTDAWRDEYGKRVDRFIKALKKRNMAIYWVGQPIMRRPEINEPVQVMNAIVREKAYLNGVKYIDIIPHFSDDAGNYAAYGPDITGKQRLVRDPEGVLFSWAGYRKLAHFVEREIRRDVTQARSERNIPLAGAETEQRRIAALRPTPEQESEWKGTVSAERPEQAKAAAPSAIAIGPRGEQKADNGRIQLRMKNAAGREENVTLELPRPAIPAAVIQLITRKDTGERASPMGDALADDIGGGLVVLSSVTPIAGAAGLPRRASPSQPYYQVWIKGERLTPRPGRSDDFTWPRPDPAIDVGPMPRRPVRPRPGLPGN
jgi:hypothetical protein